MQIKTPSDALTVVLVALAVGWHVIGVLLHESPSGAASPSDLLAIALVLAHQRAIRGGRGD